MAMWNDYEKIARRLDRIANAFERIANALETANIIEADRKTEPQRNMAEDIVRSFGFKDESYRQAKAKDEPQLVKDCTTCKYHEAVSVVCGRCDRYHSKYEPQTDCSWK